jgi:TetR/AcrR family transcriptional regulator
MTAGSGSKVVELHRGSATRDRLLQVAQSLFAERGYRGTSLRDISGRIGIKAPSLLHHFSSKEQIYLAVLDRIFERLEDAIGSVLIGTDSYERRATSAVEGAIDFLARRPDYARLVWNEFIEENGIGLRLLKRRLPPLYAMAQNFIFQGQRHGAFRPEVDPFQFVVSLNQIVSGYFTTAAMTRRLWNLNLLEAGAIESRKRHVLDLLRQTLFVSSASPPILESKSNSGAATAPTQTPPPEEKPT